ncbi:hypothetical protein OAF54_02895 [bacterium]|nr:hypothetical protein [bacterium]
MGLKLKIKSQYGIDAEYWRVAGLTIRRGTSGTVGVKAELSLYPTKAVRDENPVPVEKRTVPLKGFDLESENVIAEAYTKVKTVDEFKTATDVIES